MHYICKFRKSVYQIIIALKSVNRMKINVFRFFAAIWVLVAAVGCSRQKLEVEATEVLLDKTSLVLQVGESHRLTATVLPDDATNKTLTWETSDSNVALVVDGEVIARAEGLAVITAKCGRVAASCAVSVKPAPDGGEPSVEATSIRLDRNEAELSVGETLELTATVLPDDATNKTLAWATTDSKVAVVADGVVTALAVGTADIIVQCGSVSDKCTVTVSVPASGVIEATSITLDHTSATLGVGETLTLTATVLPDNATDKTVSWTSSDPGVATVSNGKVTAVAIGAATITASCGSAKAECAITVSPVEAAAITLDQTSASILLGESLQLTASVSPDNVTDKTVSWASSNPAVASVDGGIVTGLSVGKASITARCGSVSAVCTVTVNPVEATSIELDRTSAVLSVGGIVEISATVLPGNTTDKTVVWASSRPDIASVENGKVRALSPGSATVTASCGSVSAICSVTVLSSGEIHLELDRTAVTLAVGETTKLVATVYPEDTANKLVLWASANSKIASVQDGIVTAVSTGVTTITAQCGKVRATCLVNVAPSKVVPPDIRDDIENWMPVYDGVNPPNVEGTYYIDPFVAVYCEDQGRGGFYPGDQVVSEYIQFMNQTAYNTLDYMDVSATGYSQSSGIGVFISGEGDNFTVYFDTVGITDGINTKTALIISGTKTPQGIKNLYYAFVMVEKGPDPNHLLMDEGVFRVFKDQDGLSVNATWPSYAKLSAGTQSGLALPLMRDVRR